jgi:small-conductance mechanosensitive channel
MDTNNPVLRTGVALAITVGVAYTTCTLFFWAWPEAGMSLANALFHGLDFRKLQGGGGAFNFGGFLYALVVMVIWAFMLGVVFAWLRASRRPT